MKKILLLTLFLAFLTTFSFAQTDQAWAINNSSHLNIKTDKAVARQSFPKEFKLFNLDLANIRTELFTIVGQNSSKKATVISLPNANGNIEQFEIYEASNFEPDLQAKFPEIRAFSGKGITDNGATLKLTISPQGIQTMVFRAGTENEFIEPYSADHNVYAVFKSQRQTGKLPWTCTTEDKQVAADLRNQIPNRATSSTGELKTMRLAQSCTGEYANYFGATSSAQVGLVLAAFNNTIGRCNGVFEKDLAAHLNLIASTTNVIYYNPATDPYDPAATGAGGTWNGQLQATLTSVIGEANYDIGHLFGATGGGGNAGCIGCVCVNGSKGSGFTSPADGIPMGDNFDIDYVVHEMGHQLGANHTFSMSLEGTGQNKEVGSGITIMGYAGITAQDVAPHSIDIFHETSIAQIQANLATKTCPITTNITAANATPVVAAVSNYTIPMMTPFALTGSATDANANDVLTYCWEQDDNSTTSGTASVASPTKLTGPNWLSFKPTTSPTRYCPILPTILAGGQITGPLPGGDAGTNIEALSSVARALNFRLTVRDNSPYVPGVKVGQTAFTNMTVNVSAASGPFQITAPNTNVTWVVGSTQTVTWDVSSSDQAPISCANVKISLSTDGGQTFPTVLLASTPNDGTQTVTVPNVNTASARVKVEAVGNIFFDINNANFLIASATSDFVFNAPASTTLACGSATSAGATLGTTSVGGFTTPIVLTATGNPAGTTVSFAPSSVTPGNSSVVTLNNINTLAPGTYNITVTGTSGTVVHTVVVTYLITAGTGPVVTTNPASQIICNGTPVTFTTTSATATSFQWQQSTDGGATWTNVTGATASSYTFTVATSQNGYQYRCNCSTLCGNTFSNSATLTVVTLSQGGTLSPAATTLCGAVNSTTLTLTNSVGNIIQWEYSTDGGVTFPNVVANTTNTLTVTNIAANRIYRVRVQSTGCAVAFSSNAVFTFIASTVPALSINANPSTIICQGDPVLLTVITPTLTPGAVTVNSGNINVAIPDNTPAGVGVNQTVSGIPTSAVGSGVSVALNITHTWDSDLTLFLKSPNGQVINLVNARGGSGDNFTNTVISSASSTSLATGTVPFTGTFAADGSLTAAAPTGFTPTASTFAPLYSTLPLNGTWSLGARDAAAGDVGVIVNWSLTVNYNNVTGAPPTGLTYVWTPTAGLSNTTTNPVGASPNVNTTYSVTATNASGCQGTASIDITVNQRPTITSQPVATSACAGSNTTFNVGATGTGISYQWQVSTDNCTTYTNITGATSSTLTLSAVTSAMSGNGYRCIISGICTPAAVTNCVKLNVNSAPIVSVTPTSTCGGVAGINGVLLTTGGQASPPPVPGTLTVSSGTISVLVPDATATAVGPTVTNNLTVSGIPANATITNIAVTLNMNHTYLADETFNLKAPNGVILNLDKNLGGNGNNPGTTFANTVISAAGVNSLATGTSPFTNTYKADAINGVVTTGYNFSDPVGYVSTATKFSDLYSTPNGAWTLAMADDGAGDVGTLTNWSIKIDYTTPAAGTPPITYTWSPATGLYTDPAATIPYVAGTLTPSVYAAPTVFTNYTVVANTTATGCTNSAVALVNYTPPAPNVTPNPIAMCIDSAAVKVSSSSSTTVVKSFASGSLSVAIPDNDPTGVTNSAVTVSGIPSNANVTRMDVKLNISHTWAGDMIIALKSPNNGTVNLDYGLSATGGAGATTGFVNTVISTAGTAALSSGSGTFTGTFAADQAAPSSNPAPAPAGMLVTTQNFKSLLSPASGVNGNYTLGLWDIAAGDVGTLTSWSVDITYVLGVPATPAVWSPATGLYSNAAGTTAYVAGTAIDSVWAHPSTTTTYNVTVNSLPVPPSTNSTNFAFNNGFSLATFNFTNNNSYPIKITDIASAFFAAGTNATTMAFYKTSAINGAPGAISAANGWTQFGTGTVATEIGNGTVQPFLSGLSLTIPAGATYGLAVQGADALGGNLGYSTIAAGIYNFTVDGCTITTGTNIGYAGDVAPNAPGNSPRGFIGSVGYSPLISVGTCTSPARTVTVTVSNPVVFTKQPVNATVCTNGTTTFTDAVTGSSTGHNWQVSTTNGSIGSFTNVVDGGSYSGSKTATLTISNPPLSWNTFTYRDSVGAAACTPAISGYVNLTVIAPPVVTISAAPYTSIFPGIRNTPVSGTTTLTAVATPNLPAPITYTWYRNGVQVSGASTNTLYVDIDHLGNYTAIATNGINCTSIALSNTVTIKDSVSSRVFVYPNPNSGRFQVRYDGPNGLARGINIFDARGKRVLTQSYPINSPYARMDVDLSNNGSGVYWLEVVDVNGNRLGMGRVEVLR